MRVVETRAELADPLADLRGSGGRLALVPTMGYLHEGHLALVDRAREVADRVALSAFVNPIQFGPDEDFHRYPRDRDRDVRLARDRGVHLFFAPSASEIYPAGEPRLTVDPGPLAHRLCGAHRPGHFRGVLTVVAKLFGLFRPDVALFGRKDFQQLVLIRTMVRELELGVAIEEAPVVREPDGLAMSSRNALMAEEDREEAAGLFRGLEAARAAFAGGERDVGGLLDRARARMEAHPAIRIQYLELVDPEDLSPVAGPAPPDAVMAVAAHVGGVRLIDNVTLGAPAGAGEEPPGREVPEREKGLAPGGRREPAAPDGAPESAGLHPVLRAAAEGRLPDWARVSEERRAHLERVADLLEGWARDRDEAPEEVVRWRAAGFLHDAVRDAEPSTLRPLTPPECREWPGPLLHGPAAAELLREEGVEDRSFRLAVAYHSVGHPGMDPLGRSLYAADFLEPGRAFREEWRRGLRARMPGEADAVLAEILRARIGHHLTGGRPVFPPTVELWNAVRRRREPR